MSKVKFDPLEAAKVPVEGDAPKAAPAAPAPKAPAATKSVAAPAASAPATTYRVLEAIKVSVHGVLISLSVGAEIDAAGYGGAPGIEKLIAQGVKLELVG